MNDSTTPHPEQNRSSPAMDGSSAREPSGVERETPHALRVARISLNKTPDLRLLWVDLTVAVRKSELPKEIRRRAAVSLAHPGEDLVTRCQSGEIDVVCFDFDYPDQQCLRRLQQLKRSVPKVPIIMLTLQHSESLAIWAFRSHVWDYLVKPIPEYEIARCFEGLAAAVSGGRRQVDRTVCATAPQIVTEALSRAPGSAEIALAPALNFVENHYRSKITLEEVASLCNLNRFQFSRKFKETYQIGFSNFVLQFRLGIARQMLSKAGVSVTEVCYSVGFNDASYFTKSFRKLYGVLPSLASTLAQTSSANPLDHLPEPLRRQQLESLSAVR